VNVKLEVESLSMDARKKVTAQLIEGVDKGEGMRPLRRRLMESMGLEKNRADVIARTETMRAFNDAQAAQYKRYGIERVKFYTADDERVCNQCGPLHDKDFDREDAPQPPIHPRCRCVLLPVVEEA
jgi:SPP1 gp7 family putative phage head morphogenesis protein